MASPPPEIAGDARRPPGRARRAVAAIAWTLGGVLVFTAALVGGALLHRNVAPLRRVVRDAINPALETVLTGKIVIASIDHIGLRHVDASGAQLLDPRGEVVARVTGVHADADLLGLARAVLRSGDLVIRVDRAEIDDAEVFFARAPDGGFSLVEAALPPPPGPPPPVLPPPARVVLFTLGEVVLAKAHARGELAPGRVIHADAEDVHGAIDVRVDGATVDVSRAKVTEDALLTTRANAPAAGPIALDAKVRVDVDPARVLLTIGAKGIAAGLPLEAAMTLEGDILDGTAKITRAEPALVAAIVPGWPVRRAISADAHVHGPLTDLDVDATAMIEGTPRASVTATGHLGARWPLRVEANFAGKDVDARAFADVEGLGLMTLEGRTRVRVDEDVHVTAEARTRATTFRGTAIPELRAFIAFERGVLSGSTDFEEQGISGEGSFSFDPHAGLRFAASGDVPNLRGTSRFVSPVDGSVRVRASGIVNGDALEVDVHGDVARLSDGGGARVEHARVDGRISGPLGNPMIRGTVVGKNVEGGGLAYETLRASMSGPLLSPHVDAELHQGDDSVVASGRIDVAGRGARGLKVRVRRQGSDVNGTVAAVRAAEGGVRLEGVDLSGEGIGSVRGSLAVRGRDLAGKLHGEDVDVARIAAFAGVSSPVRGVADVDIELAPDGRGGRKGHVQLALEEGSLAPLNGLSAQINATFDGEQMTTDGLVRLIAKADPRDAPEDRCDGAIAEVRFTNGEGRLAGGLLDAATWRALSGRVKLEAEDWDLRCLGRLGPVPLLLADLRGRVSTDVTVTRTPGARFPKLDDLTLRTRGLEVAGPGTLGGDGAPWASRRVDVRITGSADASTGKVDTVIALLGDDDLALTKGVETAGLELEATVDFAKLLDDPDKRAELLRTTRFALNFVVPERPIAALPYPVGVSGLPPPFAGVIGVAGSFEGTLEQPDVHLMLTGTGLSHSIGGTSAWAVPVDVAAIVAYDGKLATVDAQLRHDDKPVAHVLARSEIEARVLARGEPAPWTASVQADVKDLPLGDIPFFADRVIAGKVSGRLALESLNDKPTLSLTASIPDLRIGDDIAFDASKLDVAIVRKKDDPKNVIARGTVGLAIHGGGRLDLAGFTGLTWEAADTPDLDPASVAEISANADRFRLGAFLPFVGSALSRLDGSLDGHFLLFKPQGKDVKATLDAQGSITRGLVNVPQIGQELRNATIKIRSKGNELHFDDIVADGVRGRLRGSAIATLEGIRPKSTHLEVTIADGDDLPITVEGVPLGDARGKLALDATIDARAIHAKIDVTKLHLALPAETGRNVQELDDNPSITVSHRLSAEKTERAPDALVFDADVSLGNVVLEGKNIWVSLANGAVPPHVVLSDRLHVNGDVQVTGGRFDVLGKQFKIEEKSLVHLRDEEPTNPYLNVTAVWTAPDATEIYVDYVGVLYPILSTKLRFRSSTTNDQSKILATLLFGSDLDDSAIKKTQTDTTQQAQNGFAGAGGALAAAQFNAILAGISPLSNFQTRIGSSQDGSLQGTLIYQIGDTVSVGATFENGTAGSPTSTTTSGQNTGSTPAKSGRTTLALDWRFWPHWLIRGNVGYGADTTTSGLDLLWQYRY